MTQRRLPIYLLLDCSESMIGDGIESVQRGMEALATGLRFEPQALETAYLCVITFDREARVAVPLCDLLSFTPPELRIRCGTALGGAINLLCDRLDLDVTRRNAEDKGDYRPFVFLLTDGQPTDDWQTAYARYERMWGGRVATFYGIGCGPYVDRDVLGTLSDVMLVTRDLDPETIRKLFFWLTATIRTASTTVPMGQSPSDGLPAFPQEIVDALDQGSGQVPPKQLFLRARCALTGKPYLMRYARAPYEEHFNPVTAHPLDQGEESEFEEAPSINARYLNGAPSCPYCENPLAIMCNCGTVMCWNGKTGQVLTCPGCGRPSRVSEEGGNDFEIRQTPG